MAEYNRFVSYVYVYENNQKTLNNGFVRVETLDSRCMVYIHLKDLYGGSQTAFDVYMVRRQQDKLQGIGLGQMKRDGRQGEFYYETPKDSIENSGISLDEMAGIVIVGGRGQKYGTCWDDHLLDMRRFVVYDPGEKNENRSPGIEEVVRYEPKFVSAPASEMSVVAAPGQPAAAAAPPVEAVVLSEQSAGTAAPSVEAAASSEQSAGTAAPPVEAVASSEYSPESELKPAADIAPQAGADNAGMSAVPLMAPTAGRPPALEEKLDKILAQGPKMYPFEDDRVASCIRFDLQDMGMLPMKFWSYVSNSFLLHHYYCYRHLILGKFADGSFFLGVPGMGQPKDRFMAELSGFKEFKAVRENEKGQSDFGYWYIIFN